MKYTAQDPGPTGQFSPAKIAAVAFGAGAPAPMIVYLLGAGPETLGPWIALALTVALGIASAGLWWGLGKGAFRGLTDALGTRVEDDES